MNTVMTGLDRICEGEWQKLKTFNLGVLANPASLDRKLNAAKGGGFIFQSDHSVSSEVSGPTYDYIVNLVREYGNYPLDLKEYDEEVEWVFV